MAEKKTARQPRDMKTLIKAAVAKLLRFLVLMGIPAHIAVPFLFFPPALPFLLDHLTYFVAPLVVLLSLCIYGFANYSRTHPPKDKRGKPRRPVRAPRVSLKHVVSDATDIIANLDHVVWRIAYLVGFVAALVAPIAMPVTVADMQNIDTTLRPVLISAGIPAVLALVLVLRMVSIMRARMSWIEEMYAIARDCLDYKPLPERGTPTNRQRITATPHLAIEVRKWKTLTEGDTCFVWVPEKLSASAVEAWDEFGINLEEKMPRAEEWRIRTKGFKGRGALVGPANYPRAVLWDGEYDDDPLTFILGVDLETGEQYKITFNDASPHAAISGGTSSGKTSGAEVIAAQALVKPMPWDPTLYGEVHVMDPKGPFAQRWTGRPGVVVSNGQKDSVEDPYVYNEDGDIACEKTGVMVMSDHIDYIEEEHKRRADVLSRYPDAGTWVALPDEVKRDEKFFPIFIILDEFLDHTSGQRGKGIRIEMENEAREHIVSMTDWQLRKARNVGIHILLIAQRANMKLIGDTMMTNMPVRLVTGQIDKPQLTSMFAIPATDVPRLPSTYHDPDTGRTKTIPGRARILNALGQSISKIQIMWFGGGTNSETLDKWLPRGEKPVNGNFSLPTGTRPRTKDDFDEDGNYVGEIDEAAKKAPVDADGNTIGEPVSAGEHGDDGDGADGDEESLDHESADSFEPVSDLDDDDQAEPNDGTEGDDKQEPAEESGIFPAAATENSCEACDAESSWSCPECSKRYCTAHGGRTRNPDPDAAGRFVCGECASSNPLVAVGMDTILPEVDTKVRRYKLHYEHAIREDDNGEYGELRVRAEEGGKKIVEVFSRPQEDSPDNGFAYRARSSSGTVQGLAAVQDRIDVAISTYVRSRKEKTGGDAA